MNSYNERPVVKKDDCRTDGTSLTQNAMSDLICRVFKTYNGFAKEFEILDRAIEKYRDFTLVPSLIEMAQIDIRKLGKERIDALTEFRDALSEFDADIGPIVSDDYYPFGITYSEESSKIINDINQLQESLLKHASRKISQKQASLEEEIEKCLDVNSERLDEKLQAISKVLYGLRDVVQKMIEGLLEQKETVYRAQKL